MSFAPSSRARLTERSLARFPTDSLFDSVGRAVCEAGCLPRKELFESWEVARRVRRTMRGGRVVDLACGHGLTAALLLLLDDSSPEAIAVDRRIPKGAPAIHETLVRRWPRLEGRVHLREADVNAVPLSSDDLVVSVHACGTLTDEVLERAIAAGARLALLPCCHPKPPPERPSWRGWVDDALALDLRRALRLETAGYRIATRRIPESITPKNRLLLAWPPAQRAPLGGAPTGPGGCRFGDSQESPV